MLRLGFQLRLFLGKVIKFLCCSGYISSINFSLNLLDYLSNYACSISQGHCQSLCKSQFVDTIEK